MTRDNSKLKATAPDITTASPKQQQRARLPPMQTSRSKAVLLRHIHLPGSHPASITFISMVATGTPYLMALLSGLPHHQQRRTLDSRRRATLIWILPPLTPGKMSTAEPFSTLYGLKPRANGCGLRVTGAASAERSIILRDQYFVALSTHRKK